MSAIHPLRIAACALALVCTAPALAAADSQAKPSFTVYRSQPEAAAKMLQRAVEYLHDNSAERAFAAFNNQRGQFHQNDLYVFVVDARDGVMRAYGAAPEAVVGDRVMDLQDASGRKVIREMFDAVAAEGSGTVDYVWLNRMTNRVEKKTSRVVLVGDYLVGVGYYPR